MKKYYDAVIIKEIINKLCNEPEFLHYGESFYSGVSAVDLEILTTPFADVAEVKHGKWLDTNSCDVHYQPIYTCSVCGKEVADTYIKYHKYCLHCGAKMLEEKI